MSAVAAVVLIALLTGRTRGPSRHSRRPTRHRDFRQPPEIRADLPDEFAASPRMATGKRNGFEGNSMLGPLPAARCPLPDDGASHRLRESGKEGRL